MSRSGLCSLAAAVLGTLMWVVSISPLEAEGSSSSDSAYLLSRVEAEGLLESLYEVTPRSPRELRIPVGDGRWEHFRIEDSRVLPPALSERHPRVRALRGRGVSDPAAEVRLELGPEGIRSMVRRPSGALYIQATESAGGLSVKQRTARSPEPGSFLCSTAGTSSLAPEGSTRHERFLTTGDTLRELRLAVAATGEFTQQNGGTVESGLAAVTTVVNRVNALYERELSIRFTLVENNDQLIYMDPASDPYTENDPLGENQANLDAVIGDGSYDLGHLFGAARGGVVDGLACITGRKARAISNDRFDDLDFFAFLPVSHEIGHQLSAGHTHNSAFTLFCELGRQANQAFEPGSGSTVMSYGGICEDENVVPVADEYFHTASLEWITQYIQEGGGAFCGVSTDTGNAPPLVDAGGRRAIPKETPFVLTGNGSDPDGDPLTFTWEQLDLGQPSPPMIDDGRRPLFRSFPPSSSPVRTLPQAEDVRRQQATLGETLPTRKRKLTFRLTARDQRGGVATDTTVVKVVKRAGPFEVRTPQARDAWEAGANALVEWEVARTDRRPIQCKQVAIELSTDGGWTFGGVLAGSTPNDGAEEVRVPATRSKRARVRVRCVDGVFWALSPGNFRIRNAPTQP